jgi:hypothetical protein
MSEVEHVGFTGTRLGVSARQGYALLAVLAELKNDGAVWFHHGDCIGADFDSHVSARGLGYKIHVHPPEDSKYRASVSDYDAIESVAPYMIRNQAIVDTCAILIACPAQLPYPFGVRPIRSGTWSTVAKARKKGIPRIIVYADGTVERE